MKIKTKKQMTLEEYAKYMIDKRGVHGFESETLDSNIIDAPNRFTLTFELNKISKEDLPTGSFRNGEFTVEIEEEITEDTVIPKMIRIYEKDCLEDSLGYQRISIVENFSIGFELNRARSRREEIKTIHIVNDDGTHTLIWRDGKLVE